MVSMPTHRNRHGFKGVEWDSSRKMYRARIGKGANQGRWLGRYATAEEAALAYDTAARARYGEEAFLNFPHPGEKAVIACRREDGMCPAGHLLSERGYISPDDRLLCRECNLAANKKYRQRPRKAAEA